MTTTLTSHRPRPPAQPDSLRARRLPGYATPALAVLALLVAAGIVYGVDLGGPVLVVVLGALLYLAALFTAANVVEGRRSARNRVWSALIHSALVLAVLPLASVVWTLVSKGTARLDADFFGSSMNNIGARDANGGAYHAIVGTLEQVGIATAITVPLGVLCAIYIVEYGRGRFAFAIRFFVDVMTGIPSIVTGLFVLAFWVLIVSPWFNDGRPSFSGFAAALALSVLMLPTVVRSTEEMLRLVPAPLREGRTPWAYRSGRPSCGWCCPPRCPASSPASCSPSRGPPGRPPRCCSSPAVVRRSTSTRSRTTSRRWPSSSTSRPARRRSTRRHGPGPRR